MLNTLAGGYKKLREVGRADDLSLEELEVLKDFGLIKPHCNGDLEIVVELLDDRARLPEYSDPEDAGLDAFACLFDGDPLNGAEPIDEVLIGPGETKLVCLGVRVGLPKGWYLDVRPRSGISLNTPLRVANAPGTIDTNYKGALQVVVHNSSPDTVNSMFFGLHTVSEKGNKPGTYVIKTGDKICQLVPQRRYKALLTLGDVDSVGNDRGGGFGHSGV